MKPDKWIEKDEKLAARPRAAHIVTYLDLEDPKFMKKYPDADKSWIGKEIPDPKPLFWLTGLTRKPTVEEQHARVAAQFRRDLEEEMELGQEESLLYDDSDMIDAPQLTQYEAIGAVFEGIPEQLSQQRLEEPAQDPEPTPEPPNEEQ